MRHFRVMLEMGAEVDGSPAALQLEQQLPMYFEVTPVGSERRLEASSASAPAATVSAVTSSSSCQVSCGWGVHPHTRGCHMARHVRSMTGHPMCAWTHRLLPCAIARTHYTPRHVMMTSGNSSALRLPRSPGVQDRY